MHYCRSSIDLANKKIFFLQVVQRVVTLHGYILTRLLGNKGPIYVTSREPAPSATCPFTFTICIKNIRGRCDLRTLQQAYAEAKHRREEELAYLFVFFLYQPNLSLRLSQPFAASTASGCTYYSAFKSCSSYFLHHEKIIISWKHEGQVSRRF